MGRATDGVSEMEGSWYTCDLANMALAQALGEPGYTGLGRRKNQVCRGYGWNGEAFSGVDCMRHSTHKRDPETLRWPLRITPLTLLLCFAVAMGC